MTSLPRQRRASKHEAAPQRRESPAPRVAAFTAVGASDDTGLVGPSALKLRRLVDVLASYAPHDGGFALRLPGTYAIRLSRMGRSTDAIVDPVIRLLELMVHPEDADLFGPLVVDEIVLRLLRSPIGSRVAQIGQPKSGVQRMAEAVSADFHGVSRAAGPG